MKKLLTLSLIFAVFYVKSQSKTPFIPYYNLGEPWQFQNFNGFGENYEKIQDSLIKLHNIKTKNSFSKNKKGQFVMYSKNIYSGKEGSYKVFNLTSRKTKYKSYHKINNYRIYDWKMWGARRKLINEYTTINNKEFLTQTTSFKKEKQKGSTQYFWNEDGVLDSLKYFSKRNITPSKTIHYFYKNEKLEETKTYEKGKLTTIRKYNCTPLGEIQKKVKQTTQCVNTEFDAEGNKIKVTEYTDEKGRVRKWKTTYNGDSDVVLKREGFDYKNRKTYFEENTPEKLTFINYHMGVFRKGKESFKQIKYFDKDHRIVKKEIYNNGKKKTTIKYTYNNTGRLNSIISFNKKGGIRSQNSYEYNNLGLKIKETTKFKKKTYEKKYEYK